MAVLLPGKCSARWLPGQVALGVQADRAHRAFGTVRAGEIGQTVGEDGSRHGNVPSAVQFPNLLAVGKIVTAALAPAVDDDLGPVARFRHGGRAPCRNVMARRPPQFATVGQVEFRQERIA